MPSGDLVADPTAIAQMRAAVARREPYHGTLRNYRKEGTPFWNALNIRPVFDDLGESDETYRLVGLARGAGADLWAPSYRWVHPDDLAAAEAVFVETLRTRGG